MNLPKIYAHIAPDGRLLEARAEPPISEVTAGGRVYEYGPLGWEMSNEPDFKLPEGGRPVVCKVLTLDNGVDVPERAQYGTYWNGLDSTRMWGLWGWKYLEG